ncbi:MAG TPA: MoaD/ThiS family protein [Tepidisphaeraceae bacterium]|jgi:molybdopterin converting factor small subunit|nr:MoaD/ThiS family protein [Tepidisphaeraceae bacterium]
MRVRVLLFAILRDAAGAGEIPLDLEDCATAASAAARLAEDYPALKPYLPRVAFAVNRSYTPATTELHDGDELVLIPPVSGG